MLEKMLKAYNTEDKKMTITREDILLLSSVKDTLKFYGDVDNYAFPIYDEHGEYNGSWVDKDGGILARVTLLEL